MISAFDKASLDEILKDFYTVIGIRISIFDDKFDLVTEYPAQAPEFCSNIRKSEKGRLACRMCDIEAFKRAKKLRKPHIYVCHAGITEAITPIQLGGGVLGYAILAHMLPDDNFDEAVKNACALAEKYGVPHKDSLSAISGISKRSSNQINAAVRLLDAVSSYLHIQNLAKWKNEDISDAIEKYIRNNIKEKITSEKLCRRFNCSRAGLYQISMKAFGMGIMQYVVYRKMEKAKELLSIGNSITYAAYECGFDDYNYFCKLFKKHTGLPPGKFQKNKS